MKALAMFSGGLDSCLAVRIIQKQNIEVIGIGFETPFFPAEPNRKIADLIQLPFHVVNITSDLIPILQNPQYGYGKAMNPCIDCHALMMRKTIELLPQFNASFIITGEVMGQRPKSQSKMGLNCVNKLVPDADLVVRPLSQKLLADTLPIREGWIDKDQLYDIQGRSRKSQFELVAQLGLNIKDLPTPAGGCLLTDKIMGKRIKCLLDHDLLRSDWLEFVPMGRHFLLPSGAYLVLGRDQEDNQKIAGKLNSNVMSFSAVSKPGPLGVLWNVQSDADLDLAGKILLRYIKNIRCGESQSVRFFSGDENQERWLIKDEEDYSQLII